MADVQIKKLTAGLRLFSSLPKGKITFIAFNFKSKLFLDLILGYSKELTFEFSS